MLSPEYIRAKQDKKTNKARLEGTIPYLAESNGDKNVVNPPFIGVFVPYAYEVVDTFFVDKTGIGADSEPALTLDQFLAKVKKGFYYAIKEEGQFQIYIREFKKLY